MSFNDLQIDDIDLNALDKLANSNSMARERQKTIMQNTLRRAANFFSFVSEAKIDAIAKRLQQNKIGSSALKIAVDKIIDNYEKFPSYKVIVELCRVNQPKHFVKCDRCFDGGLLSLYEKETGFNYAFSCDCLNGSNFPHIPSVRSINLNLYTRYAPLKKGVKNPYEGLKEAITEYNARGRANKTKHDINFKKV